MADKEYNIKIGADTKAATQDIDNLNTALEGTATALTDVNTAAKTTGDGLKDVGKGVPDIENAEKAIKSLEGATKLVAGGIAASTGAMALFGAEGEKLKEIEVKVQGAIAVAMGVREAAEGAVILVQQRRFIQEKAIQAATKASIAI